MIKIIIVGNQKLSREIFSNQPQMDTMEVSSSKEQKCPISDYLIPNT